MILWTRVLISGHQPKQACHHVSKPLAKLDRSCEGKYICKGRDWEPGFCGSTKKFPPQSEKPIEAIGYECHTFTFVGCALRPVLIDISESRVVCWTNREFRFLSRMTTFRNDGSETRTFPTYTYMQVSSSTETCMLSITIRLRQFFRAELPATPLVLELVQ